MTGPTFIEGDRLDLKPAAEEDIPFLQEGVNHPRVRQYTPFFRRPFTEERYRDELWPAENEGDGISLLVVPTEGKSEGKPIGSVQLHPVQNDDGYANFAIWFHPDAWGDGYAIEASAYLLDYGFRQLRLHRISATTANSNQATRTLCDRLGFVHEGTTREAWYLDGEYTDVERYGLLADEWTGPETILDTPIQ